MKSNDNVSVITPLSYIFPSFCMRNSHVCIENILLLSLTKKQLHAPMSNKVPITEQKPSPSIPRFHAIPLRAVLLAVLYARPKQFSNKLFVFVGIHFHLFLRSLFVVGSDCLSEFPHSLRKKNTV